MISQPPLYGIGLKPNSFLEGFNLGSRLEYDHWQDVTREGLAWDLAVLLEALTRGYLQTDKPGLGLPYARRWLGLDQWNEAAHRALMEVFARTGRRNAAQQQFASCTQLLKQEGIEPD